MNTHDTPAMLDDSFSIEQLESRFEMVAVPPPGGDMLHTSWSCKFEFQS